MICTQNGHFGYTFWKYVPKNWFSGTHFVNNIDTQTRQLAFEKIFNEVMNRQRRTELDLYRQIAQDEGFKYSFMDSLKQVLGVM